MSCLRHCTSTHMQVNRAQARRGVCAIPAAPPGPPAAVAAPSALASILQRRALGPEGRPRLASCLSRRGAAATGPSALPSPASSPQQQLPRPAGARRQRAPPACEQRSAGQRWQTAATCPKSWPGKSHARRSSTLGRCALWGGSLLADALTSQIH